MSKFPSPQAKAKAVEIMALFQGVTIADIHETLSLVEEHVRSFSSHQVYDLSCDRISRKSFYEHNSWQYAPKQPAVQYQSDPKTYETLTFVDPIGQ